jgi:acetoacetyl-CoA synthetase
MRHGVAHLTTLPTIETITGIWQGIFRRPQIGSEDNFFDLGGDPSLAAELFSEIAKVFGRELSPLMIYQAPTITALATVVEQSSPVRIAPLLLLKAGAKAGPKTGNAASPVFITHGIGSSVMDFFELVKHIETPRPIYGMQARGTDGVDEPLDTIEDMAQFFLDAIKAIQPRGPYLLIGYSLGGLITLEMAQCLIMNGEKVALLALLETYPHRSYLPFGPRVQLSTRLVRHHASAMMKLPARGVVPYIRGGSEYRWKASQDPGESEGNNFPGGELSTLAMLRVSQKAKSALARYRPRAYGGRIRFVKAAISLRFPENPRAVWADLLPQLEVEIVPGTHQGIVRTEFKSLAAVLSRYLKEASG